MPVVLNHEGLYGNKNMFCHARQYNRISALGILTLAEVVFGQMPVTKVMVGQAREIEVCATVTLVGTVTAARISRVASEVAGIADEMPVREGDLVHQGDVLCRLNTDTLQWSLAEARSKREALRAVHEELLDGTRREDLARLKAQMDEALADLDRWRFEIERVERLYSGSDSNAKELTDARAEYAIAGQRVAAAEAAYEKGVAGPRPYEISKAAHDLEAQDAIVKRLERDLEKSTLRAPFSGAIVDRFIEVGEWVDEGAEVVELAALDRVLIRVDAPESAFPHLVTGEPTRVMIDALKRSFDGRIKHVIPKAAPDARTIPVDVEVDNREGLLAGGMFARVTLRAGPVQKVVGVPKDAVVERDGVFYVATVVPGRQGGLNGLAQPVTLGAETDEWIAITSGNLEPGRTVIIRGNERMAPFPMPIEIVDELGRPVQGQVGGGKTAPSKLPQERPSDRRGT